MHLAIGERRKAHTMVASKKAAASRPKKSGAKPAAKAPPWERDNPKAGEHHHLSPPQKAEAKREAKAAGRPYPNLVDNMRVARESKKK